MNYLVIGLGSMGKRRVRCLKALNVENIYGYDNREDRLKETEEKYKIKTFSDFEEAIKKINPEVFLICLPPDKHIEYIDYAINNNIHFFVEASVLDHGLKEAIEKLKKKKIIAAPSSTLMFHPAIKKIKEIVSSGSIGKISNILYHSGQYLPDWHTYEKVNEFYVSNPDTGGGREIVPFELTWFTEVFGMPKRVCANFRKTINIEGAEYIDDTYNILLDYRNYLAVVTVDVVSRNATRKLTINGDKKQLHWNWDENSIQIFDPKLNKWQKHEYEMKKAENGYNENIGENMYIEEVTCFLDSINKKKKFINSMEKDYNILQLLYKIERSDNLAKYIEV